MVFNLDNLFKVDLIPTPGYQFNGLRSYASALNKFEFVPTLDGPFQVLRRVHSFGKMGLGGATGATTITPYIFLAGPTGQVPAQNIDYDSQWLGNVTIGTSAQSFQLNFDSGSSDLWVWSTRLSQSVKNQDNGQHDLFDPTKSSTFKNTSGASWKISYGDGSTASGDVGTDTLNVGGLSVEGQGVELAKQLSQSFLSAQGDGLLGLGFGNINTVRPVQVKTPVENMIIQGDVPSNAQLFTVYLTNYDHNDQDPPFYTFGYIDKNALGGQTPAYTSVDSSRGYWQFNSTSAVINGKTVSRPTNNIAIADTGTSLALVDDTFLKAIYAAIPGSTYDSNQQGWTFPSNTPQSKLPTVSVAVGGSQFIIHKEDFFFGDIGNGYTFGGIQSRGNLAFDILGDTWLKGVYAIFDQGKKRFGVVQRKQLS